MENVLQIAANLFAVGRIADPDDWQEMSLELSFELLEMGWTKADIQSGLGRVKDQWYSEKTPPPDLNEEIDFSSTIIGIGLAAGTLFLMKSISESESGKPLSWKSFLLRNIVKDLS